VEGAAGDTLLGIDARVWQAVVAGAFLAPGRMVNGWQNRRERRALRDAPVPCYSHLHAIEGLADDMRARGQAALRQERRVALYEDCIPMKGFAPGRGEFRQRVIETRASEGKAAAEAAAGRLGSPGAGPSAP